MKVFKYFLFSIVLLVSNNLFSQNQNNQWRFGNGVGVNFNTSPPTAVNGTPINTNEGSASIADKTTGALLFYTDGIKIWNANNVIMPNGSGLFGGTGDPNLSSTSAAVIVPKPLSSTIYYVITVDDQAGNQGLCYSVVDMTLNGGLGDVVAGQKNILIYNTKCEKLAVVPNATNCGYWLVAHGGVGTSNYLAFEITSIGISLTPVISTIGQTPTNNVGHFKINRQFNKLAVGDKSTRKIELFDFNNATGVISNPIFWIYPSTLTDSFYGVEFSPDGSKLYLTNAYALFQYDLSVLNSSAIENSFYNFTPFFSYPPNFDFPAALQLGPDNKIYIAANTLYTLTFPNLSGASAGLQAANIAALQGQVKLGLPQWIYSIDNPPNSILQTENCITNAIPFSLQINTGVLSVSWNFGDPTSGASNTATGLNPSHIFSASGSYTVTATINYNCRTEVVTKIVTILAAQTVSVAPISLCQGATPPSLPTTIPATTIAGTWLPATINTTSVGTSNYVFTADAGQCVNPQTTTLTVTILPIVNPLFTLPTAICPINTAPVLPTTSNNGVIGTWLPATVSNTTSGTYTFTPTSPSCAPPISVTITVNPTLTPIFSISNNFCSGSTPPILPLISDNNISGTWSPSVISTTSSATYVFTPTDSCSINYSLTVTINPVPIISINQGCNGAIYQAQVESVNTGDSYSWLDATNTVIGTNVSQNITAAGDYKVIVTNNGCATELPFTVNSTSCVVEIPKGFSPNGDGANDTFDLANFNISRLEIFNRYGTEVYSRDNYTDQWNGKSKDDKDLPSATYFYYIKFSDGATKTGWVYLNR